MERTPEESSYLALLAQADADLAQAAALASAFLDMVHQREGDEGRLTGWIDTAKACRSGSLRFALGLASDFAAVLAGLTLPVSNGQLEGQINRLKTMKRQMFGRANFDLLRRRVLYGP
jgi:transposase